MTRIGKIAKIAGIANIDDRDFRRSDSWSAFIRANPR